MQNHIAKNVQARLLSTKAEILASTIRRAEAPILLGLLTEVNPSAIAAAYNSSEQLILSTAAAFLADLGWEHNIAVAPFSHNDKLSVESLCVCAERLVAEHNARSGRTDRLYDLLNQRERMEWDAIKPLFDVYVRILNRLMEKEHGNVQTDPRP